MHLHIAGFLLAALLLALLIFGLWEILGVWLIYGPLALGGLAAVVYLGKRLPAAERTWHRRHLDAQRLALLDRKRKTAAAEAALGIPVPTEGTCPSCGAPLVAGARFCGRCRYPVAFGGAPGLPLILCPRCAERQPNTHATYCFACGSPLAVPDTAADHSAPPQRPLAS